MVLCWDFWCPRLNLLMPFHRNMQLLDARIIVVTICSPPLSPLNFVCPRRVVWMRFQRGWTSGYRPMTR